MSLTILVIFFSVAGVPAILYLVLALLSLKNPGRSRKDIPGMEDHGGSPVSTGEAAVAEAFWGRTKILLRNGRFDAALADCKQALAFDPNHPGARRLWNHLFPGDKFSTIPDGKALLRVAEGEKDMYQDFRMSRDDG
ncbi:MAG: hypothetical protein JRD64_05125 [Deltaproteobacteria bacterium]|jgi:hypothetical protein|nr:hypothetical protein [Deltaproteobacteria bacterium]